MPARSDAAEIAKLFKAYDVRGVYPDEINENIAYATGKALVAKLEPAQVAVGRDMRVSGESLAEALISGILDQGADVIDLGQVSTDALYFAVGNYEYDAGVMITASHNPPEYNGFKICGEGARALPLEAELGDIRSIVQSGGPEPPTDGRMGDLFRRDILPAYVDHCLALIDVKAIKPFKIAIDAGNGMAGKTVPLLFDHLPGELIPMYFELDGTFPNHPANPIDPANMVDLQKMVVEESCDLGVAFDGDADRMFLVDEKGNLIGGDITTSMVSIPLLERNPGAAICYNLICSKSVPETILAHGGRPVRTPVGHSLIKNIMRREDALFGGEHSGHYYFRDNWYADSGLIAMLNVLLLLSAENKPLSEIAAPLDTWTRSGEINMTVTDKAAAVDAIRTHFRDSGAEIDEFDGVTVDFGERWLNIRGSNTEPLLRVNVEGKTPALMESLRDDVLAVLGR